MKKTRPIVQCGVLGEARAHLREANRSARHVLGASRAPDNGRVMERTEYADIIAHESAYPAFLSAYRDAMESLGIDLPKIFADAEQEQSAKVDALLDISYRVGESRVCALFDYLIGSGCLDGRFHAGITAIGKNVRLPCGFADRVLHHGDGSLTVVEVKQRGSRRDHACGIGQALVYAAALREVASATDVHPALVVSGNHDRWIADACATAGVAYINLPGDVETIIEEIIAVHQKRGDK